MPGKLLLNSKILGKISRFLVDNHWFKQAKKYLAWEGSLADSGGTVGDESGAWGGNLAPTKAPVSEYILNWVGEGKGPGSKGKGLP